MEGIVNTILFLLHLWLSLCAYVNDGHSASDLSKTLLELLAIVVRGSGFNLLTDKLHTALNVGALASAFDDDCVFLVDGDALCFTEVTELHVLELDTKIFSKATTTCENSDVFEHCLTAITKARCLDSCDIKRATKFVNNQCSESFTFDILSDDEEWLVGLRNDLK